MGSNGVMSWCDSNRVASWLQRSQVSEEIELRHTSKSFLDSFICRRHFFHTGIWNSRCLPKKKKSVDSNTADTNTLMQGRRKQKSLCKGRLYHQLYMWKSLWVNTGIVEAFDSKVVGHWFGKYNVGLLSAWDSLARSFIRITIELLMQKKCFIDADYWPEIRKENSTQKGKK